MIYMMPGVQLKGWKRGKWRWRMMVGARDHQRLLLVGRIAHKIPTVMKRRLRTKSPWATTKHLRWWWWEVPTFKIKKKYHSVAASLYFDDQVGEQEM
jgi:hypothetical protein